MDYKDLLVDLLKDLTKVTLIAMEQQGVEKNSKLSRSVNYVLINDSIQLEVAYYYHYVSTGRKRGIRKVPITALIQYIKDKGISPRQGQTLNQLAFAIQNSIYRQGINPKNFEDKVVDNALDVSAEGIADGLALAIADELENMFIK